MEAVLERETQTGFRPAKRQEEEVFDEYIYFRN